MNIDLVLQVLVNVIITSSFYALLGIGFWLIYNTTKIFHMAHGATFLVSAYTAVILDSLHFPIIINCLISILFAGIFGFATEKFLYSPLRKRKTLPFNTFLASLGLLVVGESLVYIFFGPEAFRIKSFSSSTILIGPVSFTQLDIIKILVSWFSVILVFIFLKRSKYGQAIRGVASNDEKSQIVGIEINHIYQLVFFLGSSLAGIAGFVYTLEKTATAQMGFPLAISATVAVFIGGIGSLQGAIVGGVVLGIVEGVGGMFLPSIYSNILSFVLLFIILLIRPGGIINKK
jgi:branched-chain amino acid transport system permease protein